MGLIVLDTSAVAGYLDAGDALHDAAEAAISRLARERHFFGASAVTWSELMVGVGLGYYADDDVRGLFDDMAIEILVVDLAIAERAAALRSASIRAHRSKRDVPNLRLPDALILATAELARDSIAAVAGDRRWGTVPGLSIDVISLAA